jgi:RNA polymerase sigma-70 factor (sigma-E family)
VRTDLREQQGVTGAGDADEVLGALFREEYARLVGLARVLIDTRAEAEELVQEAFARTFAAWARIDDHAAALAYLRTTVVNLARGGLRRRATVRRTPLEPKGTAPAADAAAAATEAQREVLAAVRALPVRQREVVVLRYLLELSTADTAATLDISPGSVKTHLHRALAALETTLEGVR